ncbi:hypothetical protein LguiA_015116 [Lonicera macranthoides]
MGKVNNSSRALKLCFSITSLLVIVLLTVSITLFLTLLKPKQPKIITQSVTLQSIKFSAIPFLLNVNLGINITIQNPNYGNFEYENGRVLVSYRGTVAGESPVSGEKIPGRGKVDLRTEVLGIGEKLVPGPDFWGDYLDGCWNFTLSIGLKGKANIFKLLKIKATSYRTCDISVFIQSHSSTYFCSS